MNTILNHIDFREVFFLGMKVLVSKTKNIILSNTHTLLVSKNVKFAL